ncbi:MAG: PSD1 and planctomycete cytochrome C domain-containing protein [Verrucomicrobiota bacterium]|jgi:mono/diheme cytochrome c family protein|nr:PSD1 and planctomycete cytochrome C domain-containing protein [Verrucomicrobiota bacterium]
MQTSSDLRLFTAILIGFITLATAADKEGERLFALKVRGIISAKCLACHGEEGKKLKGDLDLSSRLTMLKGGESAESAVVPGNPMASPLYLAAMREYEGDWSAMPPKEIDKVAKGQLAALKRWIELGAPWPHEKVQARYIAEERANPVTAEGVLVKTSGGLAEDWTYRRYRPEDVWAFRPVVKPKVPKGAANPIDAFINFKLKATGFATAPEADFRTLVKRAYYDLTGLPPTPFEINQFRLAWDKDSAKAWDKLIDKLLASPHYGERWGQHWLDVARYSDTGGYSNDYERSNMWRYRDYVVRAFNADKPYDEFIREQIAGDELADASLRRRIADWEEFQKARENGNRYNAREAEQLVASSFLRMGPWDPAMVKKPQARQIYLDDVVNAVGETFLGTTMRCVKCHDHKFDPVPTRDYYRMYAVFEATQLAERPAPFLEAENRANFREGEIATRRLLAFATDKHNALYNRQEVAAREWYAKAGTKYLDENARKNLPDEEKPPRHVGLSPEEQGRKKVRRQDEWIWQRRLERYQPLVQSVYNGPVPKFLNARKLRMNARANNQWRPDSRILGGGALEAPGVKVTPGVLSALGVPAAGAEKQDPFRIPDAIDGRRLALGKWIAHPANPLTSRSIVNRVWQQHFGHPLAANPNNLGAKGGKPTHPELLDWLAVDFVEHGWKFKRLHRLIMQSKTYRQSGAHSQAAKLAEVDPDNRLLAFRSPRRLSAEELRDSLLKVTGELNPTLGGLPVMPEINMEVALQPRMIQFSLSPAYQPSSTPAERNRRTIYANRVRGQANPFLETFNQPNPNDSCEVRVSETVTPQAFTLLNSSVMSDRAIALALRTKKEFDTLHLQVKRAMQLAYGRVPDKVEWERLKQYVIKMRAYHARHETKPVRYPSSITRSLVEELTGQLFEYEEILPVFENYVADKKPADVSADTRALADLCLLLFNSNEFMYVY